MMSRRSLEKMAPISQKPPYLGCRSNELEFFPVRFSMQQFPGRPVHPEPPPDIMHQRASRMRRVISSADVQQKPFFV